LENQETPAIIRAMSKITLKLQDLTKGESSFQEFDDEAATVAFLRARPPMVDIVGVVFEGLTPEQNTRLKTAKRPLDADEIAAEARLAEASEKVAEAAAAMRAKEVDAARVAHREALKTADPNRPMEVRYLYNAGLSLVDAEDPRPISDEAREAVLAWVAERNEWVDGRGQIVGEAKVTVWPGVIAKKGADRVQGGTFIPVTAPPKPAS
jgi:hypothetical protein